MVSFLVGAGAGWAPAPVGKDSGCRPGEGGRLAPGPPHQSVLGSGSREKSHQPETVRKGAADLQAIELPDRYLKLFVFL